MRHLAKRNTKSNLIFAICQKRCCTGGGDEGGNGGGGDSGGYGGRRRVDVAENVCEKFATSLRFLNSSKM
jgi:hypothetical protein